MPIIVVLLYLALPPIVATAYALLWPTVSSRTGLFITLGSILGVIIALGTLFWVAQPLVGAGISGARRGAQSDTLWSLLGARLLTGVIMETAGLCLVLLLLARWLRPH
jgi:hypothetical protein